MPVKYFNGVPIFVPNSIPKKGEGYYVSYNPSARDYGVDTTALVVRVDNGNRDVYYILSGDHVEDYNACDSLDDCLRYLFDHEDQLHHMSEPIEHARPS
ncbi:hypothetical protein C0431_12500 [bacterium]|nr:hypothetical protein [bacterium]